MNSSLVTELIRTQFPSLKCTSVTPLGEGYDCVAFRVDHDWVFRFPKRADVAEQLQVETKLLQRLAARSPMPAPVPQFPGTPSSVFPFNFSGYRYIPGVASLLVDVTEIPHTQFARLGRFLSWLHTLPRSVGNECMLPTHQSGSTLEECRAEALDTFHEVETATPHAPLDTWYRYLRDDMPGPCPDSELAVTHADLAAEHVLYDPTSRAFTGIIDWSDAAIGDPALDIAAFIHWGDGSALAHAANVYDPVPDGLIARARYFAACRGVGDVIFGLEAGRAEYVKAGIRALTAAAGSTSRRP